MSVTGPTPRPRQHGGRHITGRMVLIALIGFFGFVTLVNIVMVHAAITTFGGVDTPSSYRAGLSFSAEGSRAATQEARGWDVSVETEPTADGASFTFNARDAQARPITGIDISARLNHPIDQRRDIAIDVSEVGGGRSRSKSREIKNGFFVRATV